MGVNGVLFYVDWQPPFGPLMASIKCAAYRCAAAAGSSTQAEAQGQALSRVSARRRTEWGQSIMAIASTSIR